MAVVYATTLKTTRMEAVVTALGASGKLIIGTSALSGATGVLAEIPLANPAGSVTADVLTFTVAGMTAEASAAGTAAKAELRTGAGAVVVSGLTVGVTSSGADIELDSVDIESGGDVTITGTPTITHG